MEGLIVCCRCQITAVVKKEEIKTVKSNQTAAYYVVATLASLPDISVRKLLCPLLALHLPAVMFPFENHHLTFLFSTALLSVRFPLLCHALKNACILASASGSEPSI